ncbi:MAG: hypothetical protein J3Q66DRAFT_400964 [Benniella sp.]|nr:MAG: hypothetical protein J3Q66DRAFT_400964 [Benniella sp.]
MSDLTAEELALEAMLQSRLEIISARLQALSKATNDLASHTQALSKSVDDKARRMYIVEDNLLKLQGKPGLSHLLLVQGAQPSRGQLFVAKNNEIEAEIKMGFKTLRRKFQAAGSAVATVGWLRHLAEKKKGNVTSDPAITGVPVAMTATPVEGGDIVRVPSMKTDKTKSSKTGATAAAGGGGAKQEGAKVLSVDTVLANNPPEEQLDQQQQQVLSPTTAKTRTPVKPPPIISPKALLSPTSSSNKKRNTVDLAHMFTQNAPAKPLHQHFLASPSTQRANPSLGLFSPAETPNGPILSPTTEGGFMRTL